MAFINKIFNRKEPSIKWFKVFDSILEAEKNMPINKPITVLLEEEKICFSRTQQGFFAVSDECPHLGASLSKGVCNGFMEVVCPWHSYRFDLKTGAENTGNQANMYVKTFPTKVEKTGIYIGLEK